MAHNIIITRMMTRVRWAPVTMSVEDIFPIILDRRDMARTRGLLPFGIRMKGESFFTSITDPLLHSVRSLKNPFNRRHFGGYSIKTMKCSNVF